MSSLPKVTGSAWGRTRISRWSETKSCVHTTPACGSLTLRFLVNPMSFPRGSSTEALVPCPQFPVTCEQSNHWLSGGENFLHVGVNYCEEWGWKIPEELKKPSVLPWTNLIHSQPQMNPLFWPSEWHLIVLLVHAYLWGTMLKVFSNANFPHYAYFLSNILKTFHVLCHCPCSAMCLE